MELFPDNALENHLLRVAGLPRRRLTAEARRGENELSGPTEGDIK
jgi:hypothetical protein